MCFTMPAIPPPPSFLLLTHTQIFKNRETNTNTHYLSLSLSLSHKRRRDRGPSYRPLHFGLFGES
jgi:hypothetical protein